MGSEQARSAKPASTSSSARSDATSDHTPANVAATATTWGGGGGGGVGDRRVGSRPASSARQCAGRGGHKLICMHMHVWCVYVRMYVHVIASINQSINQPTNQPINQSINQCQVPHLCHQITLQCLIAARHISLRLCRFLEGTVGKLGAVLARLKSEVP